MQLKGCDLESTSSLPWPLRPEAEQHKTTHHESARSRPEQGLYQNMPSPERLKGLWTSVSNPNVRPCATTAHGQRRVLRGLDCPKRTAQPQGRGRANSVQPFKLRSRRVSGRDTTPFFLFLAGMMRPPRGGPIDSSPICWSAIARSQHTQTALWETGEFTIYESPRRSGKSLSGSQH